MGDSGVVYRCRARRFDLKAKIKYEADAAVLSVGCECVNLQSLIVVSSHYAEYSSSHDGEIKGFFECAILFKPMPLVSV